ncbi:unnamed protein product [Amoebophrya sp. A25]|nr:unnamed protein product [Amoebophrya sp. A25]|eukprot:GSA25T00001894001.1
MNLGFVGLGAMGASMARNMADYGDFTEVHLWNRTHAKAESLKSEIENRKLEATERGEGANGKARNKLQKVFCHEELSQMVNKCHVLVMMLLSDAPTVDVVEKICLSREENSSLKKNAEETREDDKNESKSTTSSNDVGSRLLVMNCGTISPESVQNIAERCARSNSCVQFVNCAVTGRPEHAARRLLTAWISSSDRAAAEFARERVTPTFARVSHLISMSDPTASAKYKLCTNFMVYATGEMLSECLCLMDAAGIDREKLLDFTQGGILPGLIADVYAKKLVKRQFRETPIGADLGVALKDLQLMQQIQQNPSTSRETSTASTGTPVKKITQLPLLDTCLQSVTAQMTAVQADAAENSAGKVSGVEWCSFLEMVENNFVEK